jgi:sigma-B regulation protein RsbU (phosphoserine phosphatase)
VLPNIPLGYDGSYRFEEQGTMLGEGDSIVLYTDGITEARNEQREMLGLNRWREAISRQGTAGCAGLLKEVKTFMANTVPVDDITLMVIRKTGGAEPLTLRVENKIDQWQVLRTALHEYGLCAGLDKRTLKKMEVALEEAVVNIVNYSQGSEIGLTLCGLADKGISVTLSDNGIPFDPTAQEPADTAKAVAERQIGGLGIALLRQIADLLHYRRTDDGLNELTIIKNI